MSKFRAPDSFDFSQPAHWEEWITRWTRFRAITKLDTETEEIQVSSLLYTMGPQSETVLDALRLSADDQQHYEIVLAALNAYLKPKKYVIFERFYRRNQMTGEPAEQFIRALYELADKCDFTDRSTQIRDHLVVGILDERLSKEMQMMDEETLTEQKAVSMIRQAECVDKQSSELRYASRTENVHSMQGNSYAKKGNAKKPWKSSTKLTPRHPCRRCGNRSHPVQQCPAKDAECFMCENKEHFAKMCEAKMTNEVKANGPNEVKVNEQQFLGELISNTTDSCCAVVAVMGSSAEVGDVFFKLDTGAPVSVIACKEPILKRVKLEKSDTVLMGPGQATLNVLGQFTATISYKDVSTEEVLHVVDRQEHALLSKGACERLKLLTFHVDSVSEYRAKYSEMVEVLGKLRDYPYMIKLRDEMRPQSR